MKNFLIISFCAFSVIVNAQITGGSKIKTTTASGIVTTTVDSIAAYAGNSAYTFLNKDLSLNYTPSFSVKALNFDSACFQTARNYQAAIFGSADGNLTGTAITPGGYTNLYLRDYMYGVQNNTTLYKSSDILATFNYFKSKVDGNFHVPEYIQPSGAAFQISFHSRNPLDNQPDMVELAYEYFKLTSDTSFIISNLDFLKNVISVQALPFSSDSMVYINPSGGLICDYGFKDAIITNGKSLFINLLVCNSYRYIYEMTKNIDKNTAILYLSKYNKLRKLINTKYYVSVPLSNGASRYNGEQGYLRASVEGTLNINRQDIWGMGYAASTGILNKDNATAVAKRLSYTLNDWYAKGGARQIPLANDSVSNTICWDSILLVGPNGYGKYQDGAYWSTPMGWILKTINIVNPGLADSLFRDCQSVMQATNYVEWRAQGNTGDATNTKYVASANFLIGSISSKSIDYTTFPLNVKLNTILLSPDTTTSLTAYTRLLVNDTLTSSPSIWSGRVAAGGKNSKIIFGELNSKAWLGAHNNTLTAWNDIYINPDGGQNCYIGAKASSIANGTLLNISNSTSSVAVMGKLGVGTSTPSYTLDVNGTGRYTGHLYTNSFGTTDLTGVGLKMNNTNFFQINTDSSTSFGNLLTNNYFKISKALYSSYTSDGLFGATATPSFIVNGAGFLYFGYSDGGNGQFASRLGTQYGNGSGVTQKNSFGSTYDGAFTVGVGYNNTERFRVDSAGNIGLSNNAPAYKLDVLATANPLRLQGLQAGASTDLVVTSNAGVLKTQTAAQVVQNGITKTSVTSTFTVAASGEYLIPFTLTGTTNTSIVAASYIATDVTGCSFSIPYLAGDGTGTVKVTNRTASAVTFTSLKVNFAVVSY